MDEALPHLQRAAAARLRTVAFVQERRVRIIKTSDFFFFFLEKLEIQIILQYFPIFENIALVDQKDHQFATLV